MDNRIIKESALLSIRDCGKRIQIQGHFLARDIVRGTVLSDITITGTVTGGVSPIEGATITFSYDGHTETTTADGTYSSVVCAGITTTVTPTHPGYATWDPADRTITNATTDQPDQDFAATAPAPVIPVLTKSGIVVFVILLSVLACLMLRTRKKESY